MPSLTKLIQQYSAGHELAEKTGLDPALMERLKSLGYAGFSGGRQPDDYRPRLARSERPHRDLRIDFRCDGREPAWRIRRIRPRNLMRHLKSDPDSVPVHYLLGLELLSHARISQVSRATAAGHATQP